MWTPESMPPAPRPLTPSLLRTGGPSASVPGPEGGPEPEPHTHPTARAALRPLPLQQLPYEGDELVRFEGLGEERVDADLEAGLDLERGTRADDREGEITRPRIGTQPSGGPKAVQTGHDDIERDDVGPHLMNDFQTLGTIGGGHDLETLKLEIDPDQLPDDLVVVHNKHPTRRAWHNSRVGRHRPPRPGFPHFHPLRATRAPPRPRKPVHEHPEGAGSVPPVAASNSPHPTRPRSSGDRATASGAVCAGSNPAGGTRLGTAEIKR